MTSEQRSSIDKGEQAGLKDSGKPVTSDTGESQPTRFEIIPGDVIELANLDEFVVFEDVLARIVYPNHDPQLWASREPIHDYLKPPGFNGRVVNIRLQAMDEPYERLLDAHDRGWKGQKGAFLSRKRYQLSPGREEALKQHYYGFIFTGDAKSSRGSAGQIQAELWYYPVPHTVRKAGEPVTRKDTDPSGNVSYRTSIRKREVVWERGKMALGKEINRVVTKPKLEGERLVALLAQSRKFGLTELRIHAGSPIAIPFGGKRR